MNSRLREARSRPAPTGLMWGVEPARAGLVRLVAAVSTAWQAGGDLVPVAAKITSRKSTIPGGSYHVLGLHECCTQMRMGAMTLLSSSTTDRCGDRRSQKGGSHGEDRCSRRQRARGIAGAETSAGRNAGVDGHRHLAVEGRVLPALGWQRTAPTEYAVGHRARARVARALPRLPGARGLRGVRVRLRAGVVAAGARGRQHW